MEYKYYGTRSNFIRVIYRCRGYRDPFIETRKHTHGDRKTMNENDFPYISDILKLLKVQKCASDTEKNYLIENI